MERKENKEKVLVPVRRRGPTQEELQQELPKEPDEVKVRRMSRRWYVY